MSASEFDDLDAARRRLAQFLAGKTPDRLFRHPTGHPSGPTGFCPCDRPLSGALGFYLKAALLELLMKLPFNHPKIWILRRVGARVGRGVYISAGVWIDPVHPQLLTIEDDVFVGTAARISLHEFRVDEFRAGKVTIRRGAFIGGSALIGCGVEIGERAMVAAGAVVGRDVPREATAIGNPARIIRKTDQIREPGA